METPIKLRILADRSDPTRSAFVRLLEYLSKVGAIVFDEQLRSLDLEIPDEALARVKRFSQRNPDFFPCMEVLEEQDDAVLVTFIAGWNAEECVLSLEGILSSLGLEHQIQAPAE